MKVRYAVSHVYDLLVFAVIVVPALLVVLAVLVDLRSRRAFGLVLLVLAAMGYCLWRIVPTEQGLQQAPASERGLFQIGLFLDVLVCGYLTLLVWIGTVIEVSMARQLKWLTALIVEAVLAVLAVVAVVVQLAASLSPFLGGVEALLILLVPMVTALAYGVVSSARPTPRPEPEPAPGALAPAAAGEVPQQSSGMRPQPAAAAQRQGSVIAVRILSTIAFLSVSLVIVLAVVGAIRTPWNTFPAGTSQDTIGLAHLGLLLASWFLGLPASVVAIVVGHITLVILRRIPHRPEGKAPGRVVLTVLLVASLVTAYLAVAMQIYYWVIFSSTNGYG